MVFFFLCANRTLFYKCFNLCRKVHVSTLCHEQEHASSLCPGAHHSGSTNQDLYTKEYLLLHLVQNILSSTVSAKGLLDILTGSSSSASDIVHLTAAAA